MRADETKASDNENVLMRSMDRILYIFFVEEQRPFSEWCIDITTVRTRGEPWATNPRVSAEGHADV